jgi:uncharacterized protein
MTLPGGDAAQPVGRRAGLELLLLALAAWIGGTVLASTLLAPPVFWLVDALAPDAFRFDRVLRRVALLVAVLLLVAGSRRLGVRGLADIGLGWSAEGRRALVAGLGIGCGAVALLVAIDLGYGPRTLGGGGLTLSSVVAILAGAALIGLLEEGICRGALLFPFRPLAGARFWIANATVSALYATVHFGRGGPRPREVGWGAGLEVWAGLPRSAWERGEAWVGLFLTGALFYLLARRQGHAWGVVGLHAGAVVALQLAGDLTTAPDGRSLFLVHGLLPGGGLSLLLVAALLLVALLPTRRAPAG